MIEPKIIDRINKIKNGAKYSSRGPMSFLKTFYSRTRTHMSLTHYSIALFPFALIAQIINIFKGGDPRMQWATSFLTICATIMLIPAIISGIISFKINFKGKTKGNMNLRLKIAYTPLIIVLSVTSCILSVHHSTVINGSYTVLLILLFMFMIIMEVNGKKLTFKDMDKNT